MPTLTVKMFEEPPKVGDKIIVHGTVQSVETDGSVQASYDSVTVDDAEPDADVDDDEMDDSADEAADRYMKSKRGTTQ